MHHAERRLGVRAGSTTPDGLFTLQHAECQAACTEAPSLQVNYRHRFRVTPAEFDELVDDLRAGRLDGEVGGIRQMRVRTRRNKPRNASVASIGRAPHS